MTLEELLLTYGYPIIFLVTFLEGETIVIIGGYLASRGYLDLWDVIAAAFIGSLTGDQLYFYIGRIKGAKLLEKRPHLREKADRAIKLLHRFQDFLILTFRFFYGIRNVTSFVIGACGIKPLRFFILNTIGAAIWAIAFAYGGNLLGESLTGLLEEVQQYEKAILGTLVGALTLFWLYNKWAKRRKRDKLANEAE